MPNGSGHCTGVEQTDGVAEQLDLVRAAHLVDVLDIPCEQGGHRTVEVAVFGRLSSLGCDLERDAGGVGDAGGDVDALFGGHPAEEERVATAALADGVGGGVDAMVDDRSDRGAPSRAGLVVGDGDDGHCGGNGAVVAAELPVERAVVGGDRGYRNAVGVEGAGAGVIMDDVGAPFPGGRVGVHDVVDLCGRGDADGVGCVRQDPGGGHRAGGVPGGVEQYIVAEGL
jgi:hypothetical protein